MWISIVIIFFTSCYFYWWWAVCLISFFIGGFMASSDNDNGNGKNRQNNKELQGDAIELFNAARVGDTDKIHELAQKGVCMNCTDENGKTALMFAAEFGRLRAVDSLLAYGADPKMKNKNGMDAKMYAEFFDLTGLAILIENATQPPAGAPI